MTLLPIETVDALKRYAALTGSLDRFAGCALEQARTDREEYAAEYTAGKYRALARFGLMVRFLYEVCDIPLAQARDGVIAFMRYSSAYRVSSRACAKDIALAVFAANGNIFAAEAVAELFVEAAAGTRWAKRWQDALDSLRSGV